MLVLARLTLASDAHPTACYNLYDVGSDNYFCHKYIYCYQRHGAVGNPGYCYYDCSGLPQWNTAVAAWPDSAVNAAPYTVQTHTRVVTCTGGDCADGDASTYVAHTTLSHGGHTPSTSVENNLASTGSVKAGGHCIPFEVTDFDECQNEEGRRHNCHANAVCANTLGGFTCTCKAAYVGNGVTCADAPGCRNGRCFAVHTTAPLTFAAAEAACAAAYPSQNGHLASVDSATAFAFVFGAWWQPPGIQTIVHHRPYPRHHPRAGGAGGGGKGILSLALLPHCDLPARACVRGVGVLTASPTHADYWLGLFQQTEGGAWQWTDGSAYAWEQWISPDPDELPNQVSAAHSSLLWGCSRKCCALLHRVGFPPRSELRTGDLLRGGTVQMCAIVRHNPTHSKHGKWLDIDCASTKPYVCQYTP
jgi:hypothetical protein